jgi:predicted nucleotide-binding protein (sugar kinase/HSP70/actin superfamily)
MSVQLAAVASQKFTCPIVTGAVPVLTVAVNVAALPEVIDVTGPFIEVITSEVVVCTAAQIFIVLASHSSEINKRQICLIFK